MRPSLDPANAANAEDRPTDLAERGAIATTTRPNVERTEEREIRLVIPASVRYLRLARLAAAGLAGDLGFRVDAIEDLRVAIDELCAAIINGLPDDADLELVYREGLRSLVIEGTCTSRTPDAPELHGVARELLNMLADEYSIGAVGGFRNFRLVKHAGGA